MKLDRNNNSGIIYRIARSNLTGNKVYTFFSGLTIILSVTFIMVITLFLSGTQTGKERMLQNMQHVIFLNITKERIEELAADERTELVIPYKASGEEFETSGASYEFIYVKSQKDKIRTFVPAEGREPKKYDEIVVDKKFMQHIGKECRIGERISLNVENSLEDFVICGYTDRGQEQSKYTVYVSGEFAEENPSMRTAPYTALIRISGASDMESSEFESAAYEIAEDYGVKRQDVNVNGTFKESLQGDNTAALAIAFLSLFIMAASGIVIYSIFYLSVTSRVQQIGQLQTIGMTEKQIKKMVRREGVVLCAAAIPAALILGSLLAYILQPEGWDTLKSLVTAAVTGVFAFFIVQISVIKPAALAARVSPIEASKNSEDCTDVREGHPEHKKLTAFVIARLGQKGSYKKRRLMTASIAFGGIVFMTAASYLYAWDEIAYSREGVFSDAEYRVSYRYNVHNPSVYGPTDMQLEGHLSEELKDKLARLPHVRSVRTENSAYGSIEYQGAVWSDGFYRLTKESDEYFQMDVEGDSSYEYLCESDGIVMTGSELVSGLNNVSPKVGDDITLRWSDGAKHSAKLKIAAVTPEPSPTKGGYTFAITDQTMKKLWGDMNTASAFYISVGDYEKYGEQTEEEIRSLTENYSDLSLETLREKILNDSASVKKLKMQIYGISAFVTLFGILNLINMMIGNIAARRRELSVLESIGMEVKQIKNMLFWESIMYVSPAILITLLAGGAAGYGFVSALKRMAEYMNYRFPLVPCILYGAVMLLIPQLIFRVSLSRQSKASLVERIRPNS
ncbi:MAG: ABC transporter permease [Lachnospiraceae bacterium]